MDRVKGKVAIITGAARGLGKADAVLLAKEGAKVVITDILEDLGKKTAQEIKAAGGEAVFMKLDVINERNWDEVVDKTMSQFGKLNVLVNNAGVIFLNTIEDTPLEQWRWLMNVNIDGVFLGMKHCAQAMKKSGGGSIINISSVVGIIAINSTSSAMSTSKGAVRMLTKAAAYEFSKAGLDYNIRVNSVHPGAIPTERGAELAKEMPTVITGAGEMRPLDHYPIGHPGTPEDIAHGVLWLASDDSKYVTGTELIIDGGWIMH